MNEFGALLRTLRLKQGYPRQYQAAEACDLSASYWSKLERIQRSDRQPAVEIIDRIAEGLKLSREDHDALLEASGQSTPVAHLEAVRKLLRVLRDEGLRQDVEEHLNKDMQLLIECWVGYADAKERQYERKWEAAANSCDAAQLHIQQLAGRLTAYLLDTKAASLLHHNKLDEVAAIHQEIQGHVTVAQDSYITALNLMHQGDHRRAGDHWEQARAFYLAAYDRFRTMPQRWREIARCERKIATTYLHQGDWRQALMHLESAHAILTDLQRTHPQEAEYELSRTFYVRGWAANLSGNFEEAYRHHQEGADRAHNFTTKREQTDRYLIMLGYSYLATDERQLGELEAAQDHFDDAARLCAELGCTREQAWITLGLARLKGERARAAADVSGRPDPALCDAAHTLFTQAVQEAQQTGSKYQLCMALSHRAQLALDQQTEAGNRQAQKDLTTALNLAVELDSAYYEAAVKRQLCELHLRRRNFDSLSHLAADVEELHRRYRYYHHMARLRACEARAELAAHPDRIHDSTVQNNMAQRYADALAYALCFNQYWAADIQRDFQRTLLDLPTALQTSLSVAVANKLRDHPEIRSYQAVREHQREKLAGAILNGQVASA